MIHAVTKTRIQRNGHFMGKEEIKEAAKILGKKGGKKSKRKWKTPEEAAAWAKEMNEAKKRKREHPDSSSAPCEKL